MPQTSVAASLGQDTIDPAVVSRELSELVRAHPAGERELRTAIAQHLKSMLTVERERAEVALLADRHGRRCAERLCRTMDTLIRALFELARTQLYPSQNPSEAERMTVVATGGYGRGLLAPGSDIDLLFLLPYKQTAWGESIAETILYCLWDMGLKVGHATRSVDECMRQAKADMTIRTSLLESRYLFGDRALFDEMTSRFDKEVVQGTAAEFVAAKLAEREERHRNAGASRYLVEPNVKDGKGGLRDLHTLFWIAKYVYRVSEPDEMIARGVFDRSEYHLFRRCEDFLWSVRCHLHFITGRAEERLSFDIQREIAVRLGYTEHPGLQDVERFMKLLNRLVARFKPRRRKALSETDDFFVDNNRINVADADVFRRDPVNLIRMFRLAQRHSLGFHPDAMRAITRSLKLIDKALRESAEANRLFVEILTAENAEIVLRGMNEVGVLGRFVVDFGRVVAMMQFNMYHHYTVDEHLLRCIGILADIEKGERTELAFATELMASIQPAHRKVLYVAMFLHDIAKGRIEDHSIAGARIARRLCPRFGLSAADTDTVAWLIEHHLVMSSVAQSRDLSDRKTIEMFASVVQSLERMKLLTILTTADIRAVGPGVWNGWKAQLLRTLYYETELVLTGGFSEVNRAQRVAMSQDEFRAAMTDWSTAEIDAYLARHYPAYWLKVDLAHKIAHARFLRAAQAEGKTLSTSFGFDAERGVTELTVLAPDHPRLLSIIAGA
ncbi:MAG: [protein-PII] uridylyltransferase, partial [Rhizobiales bacterium]|nr:[protein-PII] uridylyltransferase [Hyphomicrobiales bacterium]